MTFSPTRDWWTAPSPQGRPNHDLSPLELEQTYGGVKRVTWSNRRARAKMAYPDLAWRELIPGRHDSTPTGEPVDAADALSDAVRHAIANKKMTVEELADQLDTSPRRIRDALEALDAAHLIIQRSGDKLTVGDDLPQRPAKRIDFRRYLETLTPIGVLADLHYCSRYCREDVIEAMYDRFAAEGVVDVYVAGNWIDGEARFNKHDLEVHGLDRAHHR